MAGPERARDWKRSIPEDESWGGCRWCVHFRPDETCVAFPERIPLPITSGQVDHLVPRPGQVGDTVFERAPELQRGRRRAAIPHPSERR